MPTTTQCSTSRGGKCAIKVSIFISADLYGQKYTSREKSSLTYYFIFSQYYYLSTRGAFSWRTSLLVTAGEAQVKLITVMMAVPADSLGLFSGTEPSLMLLRTPVLLPLWHVKMSAVRLADWFWPNRSCSTHCYDTWITYCISSQSIFYADRKGLWRILLAWILKSYSGRSIGFVFWVFQFCAIFKLPEDNYMWLWGFSSYVSWGKKKCPHLILSQISSHKRVFVRLSGTESVRWAIPLVNSISLLDV